MLKSFDKETGMTQYIEFPPSTMPDSQLDTIEVIIRQARLGHIDKEVAVRQIYFGLLGEDPGDMDDDD